MNGIKIWDKVRINATGYRFISELNGLTGEVVCFGTFIDGAPNVGVNFGFKHPLFHDLDGKLDFDTGRNFGYDKLEFVRSDEE